MNKQAAFMLAFATMLFGVAAVQFARFLRAWGQPDELAYFYDLSERKLFVAPRTRVPPIRGINNDEADGMRAVVISATGSPRDEAGRRIAYLEKYAPELKQQLESRQTGAAAPADTAGQISRIAAQSMIFVRRLNEETWHAVNSTEAEKIMTEWQVPGADGKTAVVCSP